MSYLTFAKLGAKFEIKEGSEFSDKQCTELFIQSLALFCSGCELKLLELGRAEGNLPGEDTKISSFKPHAPLDE